MTVQKGTIKGIRLKGIVGVPGKALGGEPRVESLPYGFLGNTHLFFGIYQGIGNVANNGIDNIPQPQVGIGAHHGIGSNKTRFVVAIGCILGVGN